MKKISVCMTTCNGEKFLKQQLKSILTQLNRNDEVIISDDSSYDNTINIINSFNDARIKLLKGNFNSPILNFENALLQVTGDYIFLSDQDDIWRADKIRTISDYLLTYDLVISDAIIINESGELLEDSFFMINNSQKGFFKNLIRNSYLGCTMAFNRKIWLKALPFPKGIPMHDWWIGLIAELHGKTYFCKEKLVMYRRHENNLSCTTRKSDYSFIEKIKFRMNILKNLFLKEFNELV